jgi:hypothetical protein
LLLLSAWLHAQHAAKKAATSSTSQRAMPSPGAGEDDTLHLEQVLHCYGCICNAMTAAVAPSLLCAKPASFHAVDLQAPTTTKGKEASIHMST